MSELLQLWLSYTPLSAEFIPHVAAAISLIMLFIVCWLSFYIARNQVLALVHRLVSKTRNEWDDLLVEHQVFNRFAWLVPMVIMLGASPFFIGRYQYLMSSVNLFIKVLIAIQVARCLSAILNVINSLFEEKSKNKYLPLNATIQLLKLAIYLVAIILAVSIAIEKSPVILLSGLGALTAVLLLIFQDTIKGLVASIQISANRMVAPGDWISMPQYGADGDVLEIALNTVKVRNWDNTITTVPTYALISESFKNWRGMTKSGGRRIKRSIRFDMTSVKFCSDELLDKLSQFEFLNQYINLKQHEISEYHQQKGIDDISNPNSRRLTNIGTFRAYILEYLRHHPKVHKEMTCMVRQLEPTELGVALELYCFSNDIAWENYEYLQADIFDHLFAIAPLFELRIFQQPTGYDWQVSRSQ
ncbi:mechanosensitive ion channel family protein [Thalassotalea ponticola]|uniref:mechanosensitive ion channel family protein n=1 Tax=Thalassotalea ponticola TaxID=1523392 RepID=UPI0025B39664|nr:mechanosensitive ion channel family protein [Thalassotalea ponticola]MDN3652480.1 mechanosensitive ion channel family protein [Thalassotalea ponticola]